LLAANIAAFCEAEEPWEARRIACDRNGEKEWFTTCGAYADLRLKLAVQRTLDVGGKRRRREE
jgi:hypothetical protein